MRVKCRKTVVVAASIVATAGLGLSGLATAPAVAAPGCASGYICVYNASGSSHAFFNSDPNFAGDHYADGSAVDNNVASVSNSTSAGHEAHFYLNAGYRTFAFCVNPGSEVTGLPSGQATQVSSLLLRPRTTITCY